jgi:predicted lipoprotein with Yx(FWY)xxD motif
MQKRFTAIVFIAASLLAACGGGGGGGSYGGGGSNPVPTPVPSTGNLPLSEAVGGAQAWVDPSSHKTLYFLDVDTATGATCTAACLTIWPAFVPSASAQPSGNITIFMRADGTSKQFAYQGHPLYTFTGDSAADQATGDGFPDFGGHWHVARPDASAATPAPGGGGCTGVYC